jgi:hypothetical protein
MGHEIEAWAREPQGPGQERVEPISPERCSK